MRLARTATPNHLGHGEVASSCNGADEDQGRVRRQRQAELQREDVGKDQPQSVVLDEGQQQLHYVRSVDSSRHSTCGTT